MAFGQNIEEIVLKVRAEGRGETGAMRAEIRKLNEDVEKFFATVAEGGGKEGVGHWVREINAAAREIKVLEDALKQIDPEYQRLIQSGRDVARAFADQAEAAKKMAADRTEAAQKILAAEKLANQQAAAEMEAVHAKLKEMDDRDAGGGAESQRRNAEAVAAGTKAVRDQMQAYDDMAAVRARLGQMEAADQVTSQERLRESAALRMQEVESAVEGARRKDAAIAESAARQREAIRSTGDDLSRQMREQGASSLIAQRGHERLAEAARKVAQEQRQMTDGSKATSYAILNIAHAVQDAQYGFGALLNNIPLVVQAMGGGPGLAGTLMIAGVAAESFRPHLREIGIGLGLLEDVSRRAGVGLDGMKEKMEAISSRPFKMSVDFAELHAAEKDVEKLERRIATAKGLMNQGTSEQQESAKAVKEVLTEFTGGSDEASGTANLVELIRKSMIDRGDYFTGDRAEGKKVRDLEGAVRANRDRLADPGTSILGRNVARGLIRSAESSLASVRDRIDTRRRQEILGEIGAAAEGNEGAIGNLVDTFDKNRELFTKGVPGFMKGVDSRFGDELFRARPAGVKLNKQEMQRLDREQKAGVAAFEAAQKAQAKREADESRALATQGRVGEEAFDEGQRIRSKSPVGFTFKPLERMTDPAAASQKAFQGRQLLDLQGMDRDVSRTNPNLTRQQSMDVAQTAQRLVGQGWGRAAAINEAILQLNRELMQTMQMMQARQMGFMGTIGQLQQQNRRVQRGVQQKRPTLLPTFPGGF